MITIDPGHLYHLNSLDTDSDGSQRLRFVKREGPQYPGNVGTWSGTTTQEVLRALIQRTHYVQAQMPCDENVAVLASLRHALWQLEIRAARRRGITLKPFTPDVERLFTCVHCGHITEAHVTECDP